MSNFDLESELKAGRKSMERRSWIEAASHFERVIARDPSQLDAHHQLGLALMEMGRNEEAADSFRRVLGLNPGHAGAHAQLGRIHFAGGRLTEAVKSLEESIALDSSVAQTHLNLARALARQIRPVDAEFQLREAVRLDPSLAEAHLLLGFQLQEFGRYSDATESFERAIALRPTWGSAYLGLATSGRISDRELLSRIQKALADGELKPSDERDLHYAAGKALNDLEEWGEAIRQFELGHAVAAANLGSAQKPFDREGYARHIDSMIRAFTPEVLSCDVGSESEVPILLVGMPRSGSTLVEQMLSAHPDIGAAGELLFWRDEGRPIFEALRTGTLSKLDVDPVASKYLETLERLCGGKPYVTDKMPNNFLYLGVIHLAFPKAKIIHCRRHPVDNCLSMFMTPSRNPGPLAQSKKTLAFAYEHYARMMEHWREVLPPDIFMEVSYEDLLADPAGEVKRLLDFIGVPWNDRCLHPEWNTRTVSTPSNWQVRQPLYGSSLERWRNYRPWLGPLERLLSDSESRP